MKVEFYDLKKESNTVKKLITKASGKNKTLMTICSIVMFISSFLIGFSLVIIIPNTLKVYQYFPVYIIFLGLLLVGIGFYILGRWYVAKKLLEQGFYKEKISYEFLSNKIIVLTNDSLKREILPNEIKKFVDINGYLLMFVRDCAAFYIPPSAFNDENIRNECKNKINELIITHE